MTWLFILAVMFGFLIGYLTHKLWQEYKFSNKYLERHPK